MSKIHFLISQPKHLLLPIDTQKNRLDETVLLSTNNICENCWRRKDSPIYAKNVLWERSGSVVECLT